MAKKTDDGNYIDFSNLSSEQVEPIRNTVRTISAYYDEIDSTNESIKDTMEALVEKLNPDKESTKVLKSTVRKVSRALSKDSARQLVDEHSAIDLLFNKLGEV